MKINRNYFFIAKNIFFDVIFEKIRKKIKIKDLFAKLQILGNTPILFLKTNFDSLYENSPKQY